MTANELKDALDQTTARESAADPMAAAIYRMLRVLLLHEADKEARIERAQIAAEQYERDKSSVM